MTIAAINRFISLFSDAFGALSANVPMPEIERLAMLIHCSMDQGRRAYHVSTHVFDMCQGMKPRQVLATLFHDVVYYQLDGGFPRLADGMLKSVAQPGKEGLVLQAVAPDDTALAMCTGIFGFKAGQTLPLFGGMNEFLSAVVAMRSLQAYLNEKDLLAIAACIEATVPFRGAHGSGPSPLETLAARVSEVSAQLKITCTEAEYDRIVADATSLANRDVGSFSETDPGTFVSTTWLLIEESNAPLAAVGVYSIQEYRGALSRMEKFLGSLNPNHIFHRYRDTPNETEFAGLCAAAARNLKFACDYLGSKLLSIAIVEALALATGGDGPVSMFLGDIRTPYGRPDRAEDFLPAPANAGDLDEQLLRVLEKGRAKESARDLTDSPLTAFVYRHLGHAGTMRALEQTKKMFAGELAPRDFLHGLDREMVRAMAAACAQIALSRREALLGLERTL